MSWGLGTQLKVALGVWALVFFVGVIPISILYNWRIGTLPVVEGALSNHHVDETKINKQTVPWVKATLEFDGPVGHCKHHEVRIGSPSRPESFAAKVQVAVRKDSCYGYSLLPLNTPSASEWVFAFLFVVSILVFTISFMNLIFWLQRAGAKVRRSGPSPTN
jgi:hypothetical protein